MGTTVGALSKPELPPAAPKRRRKPRISERFEANENHARKRDADGEGWKSARLALLNKQGGGSALRGQPPRSESFFKQSRKTAEEGATDAKDLRP
jgi:hypothetical protein